MLALAVLLALTVSPLASGPADSPVVAPPSTTGERSDAGDGAAASGPTGTVGTVGDDGVAIEGPIVPPVGPVDAVGGSGPPVHPASAPTPSNPITVENGRAGTDTWRLGRSGYRTATDAGGQIKGYASATSVDKGDSIRFHVTVAPAQSYSIRIFRLGWYRGAGGRLMKQVTSLSGRTQKACSVARSTGMVSCSWTPGYTLTIPDAWTSGVYLALLTNAAKYQNYVPFVVRDDARPAPLLFQQAVATYQAYNGYPVDGRTGKSLYEIYSRGATTVAGTTRAVKVSFDRPYQHDGSGELLRYEYPFIRWLERSGYDVAYATSIDIHTSGVTLGARRGFISAGHDEYWSRPMYDAVANARALGTSLGFFSANDVYWQVRFEASASGAANRVMVCYKSASLDPVGDPSLETVRWRDRPVLRPEQELLGVQFLTGLDRGFPYVVRNATHWVHTDTGLRNGDRIDALVGGEADAFDPTRTRPSGSDHTLLSASPVTDRQGRSRTAHSSIYRTTGGGWVFGAGTFRWSWALDRPGYRDGRIERLTANLVNRFVDREAPIARSPVPQVAPNVAIGSAGAALRVPLSATDAGTGVAAHVLELQTDGGSWRSVALRSGSAPVVTLTLAPGHEYRLRTRARDAAVNWSDWAAGPRFRLEVLEEASGRIVYTGIWTPVADTAASGGSVLLTSDELGSAVLVHDLLSVGWVATRGPDRGLAEVVADDAQDATVNLHAASVQSRRVVHATSWTEAAPRTVAVRARPIEGRPWIDVDAFVVLVGVEGP